MESFALDPAAWARAQFGDCQFGDERRTKRLIMVAEQAASRPDGSTPDQSETWGDCKATYRLMDCDEVTHPEIVRPHCEQTRKSCPVGSTQLILCDTTEINFGNRDIEGIGRVGPGNRKGFYLHSGLMRDATTGEVSGLAGQILFHRPPKKKKKGKKEKKRHKNTVRRDPNRESVVWGNLIDQIGSPPEGVRWLHVCDRGADDYEVYCRAQINQCGWVIRVARANRKILTPTGELQPLDSYIAGLPVHATEPIQVNPHQGRDARTATVSIRFGSVFVPRPSVGNQWISQNAPTTPIAMTVVVVREESPPKGCKPLHWILLTSEPVATLQDALTIVGYYRFRWAVEDYHKALKTGCRVEERYYEKAARLERVTALLAIVAVRLLQIRSLAKSDPDRPAKQVVPKSWLEALIADRNSKRTTMSKKPPLTMEMTIHEFLRMLAQLGGHLGRKRDGEPGWITLWRGVEKLLLILRGMRMAAKKCG